jgi:quercetin dioxygenase-like cupin family protein
MFYLDEDIRYTDVFKGLKRKILSHGGNLMVVKCEVEKDTKVPLHAHHHEQCGYIISGVFKAYIDGKEKILISGDSYYAKSNEQHGLYCIEKGEFLDIFTPMRDDFL